MVATAFWRRTRPSLAAVVCGIAIAACSEATAPPTVTGLSLTPATGELVVGATQQLSVMVQGESGRRLNGVPVQWSSSAPEVLGVSGTGLVTALAGGSATITATAGGFSRSASFVVRPGTCAAPGGGSVSIGESRSSNMAASPCTLLNGLTAVGYRLLLPVGGPVGLRVASTGYSAGIVVTDDSGTYISGTIPNAATPRLRVTLSAGAYRVWVVSAAPANVAHSFTLSAFVPPGPCEDGVVSRILDVGDSTAAVVSDTSCILLGGPAAEGWRVTLAAPARIRVTASSAAFAPTVAITPTDYSTVINYSIANTPGTATTVAALPAGEYLVWGGSFTLQTGTVRVGVSIQPPCTASGAIANGTSVSGALAASDCPALGNSAAYADVWTLTLSDSTPVQIDLASNAFDAFLELRSADDTLIVADDDGGSGSNSTIRRTLPPGTYRIWASSYAAAATGAYTLSVGRGRPRCEDGVVSATLALGATATSAVTDSSCILLDGPAAEGWRLRLDATTRVRATATSSAFAPTVAITSADYTSLISFSIGELPGYVTAVAQLPAGEYLVWGGSFSFAPGAMQVAVEALPPCPLSGTLALGASVAGQLLPDDCSALHNPSAYADIWTFTLDAPRTVQLDLTSSLFDAWLEIRTANDSLIAFNDDFGGLNSRIVVPLAAGTYRVWASSYLSGTGAYTLSAVPAAGGLQLEPAPRRGKTLSSPQAKPGRPLTWPAPRRDETRRTKSSSPPFANR